MLMTSSQRQQEQPQSPTLAEDNSDGWRQPNQDARDTQNPAQQHQHYLGARSSLTGVLSSSTAIVCLSYPEEVVNHVCQQAWQISGGRSYKGKINFLQVSLGLRHALQQLQPVVPIPKDPWYLQAFRNFDSDRDGYIDYNSFWQIIKQFHDHHAARNVKKYHGLSDPAGPGLQLAAPRNRVLLGPRGVTTGETGQPDGTTIHRQQYNHPPTRRDGGACESPCDSQSTQTKIIRCGTDQTTFNKENSWEFVSDIIHPRHTGADYRQVFRDYEISSEYLGEGSFGRVQIATHRNTRQRRVCKSLDITCPAHWELIKQEIELMKNLNHPNILRLHETYHGGYTIYLIMELCEGGPLYQRICDIKESPHKEAILTEAQVTIWMRQILSAAAFCHEKDIIHRDIKPENILFVNKSPDSPLKVIDFGLSTTLDKIKKTQKEILERKKGVSGVIARMLPKIQGKPLVSYYVKRVRMQCAGTPHYMAPEMIRGSYDEKCDMFSTGVILYQLLSGVHPFYVPNQDNQESVRHKILNYNPPVDTEEWKAVSPEGIQLVKWMLNKDPKRRCSAVEALAHPWFKVIPKPKCGFSSQLTSSVFEGLKNWQQHNKFKQAILHLMARELSETQIKDLRKKFEAFDRKGDGTITLDELKYSVKEARYRIPEADLERVFRSLDSSGSNRIHYTEFVSALLDRRMKFEEAQLRAVFNKFDPERRGVISVKDLRMALRGSRYGSLADEDIEKIFAEIDKNNDGFVDFYEFMDLMVN